MPSGNELFPRYAESELVYRAVLVYVIQYQKYAQRTFLASISREKLHVHQRNDNMLMTTETKGPKYFI